MAATTGAHGDERHDHGPPGRRPRGVGGSGRAGRAGRLARVAVTGAALTGVLAGCSSGQDASPPTSTARPVALPNLQLASALTPFSACDDLLGYLKEQAGKRVSAYGLPGSGGYGQIMPGVATSSRGAMEDTAGGAPVTTVASAAPSGGNATDQATSKTAEPGGADGAVGEGGFSGTNVLEHGVDEPDTVKTDGTRIYSVLDGSLRIVDVSGDTPALVSTTSLPTGGGRLLLAGNRLLVLGGSSGYPMPLASEKVAGVSASDALPYVEGTTLTTVDVTDAAAPRIEGSATVEGALVDARMVDGTARVVVTSSPSRFPFVYPSGPGAEQAAADANKAIIERSTLEDWVPTFRSVRGDGLPSADDEGRPLLACERVEHPKEFAGFGMLSVLSVDVAGGAVDPADAVGVLADGQTVYGSADELFVSTTAFVEPPTQDTTTTAPGKRLPRTTLPPEVAPAAPRTAIHAFDIRAKGPAVYRASGEVDGTLLDDHAMSAYNGDLRVTTTREPNGFSDGVTETNVSVLRETDGELRRIGVSGDMGRGERVRAVRYVGDRGYVVTFRQTDPLYTVDLSNPEHPAVVGELAMLGYSAYLHPVGDGLLLGIGQDATDRGRTLGTKVSLYDVHDAAAPKELATWKMPGSTSQVEGDYHAFLYWDAAKLALLPITGGYGPVAEPSCPPEMICDYEPVSQGFTGMIGLKVDPAGLAELGRITHPLGYDTYPPCGPAVDCLPVPVPDTDPCPPGAMCAVQSAPGVADGGSAGAGTSSSPGTVVPPPGTLPTTTAVPIPTTTAAPTTTTTAPTTTSTTALPPFPEAGAPIERAIVIGDTVYTLSTNGLRASALDTLQGRFWLAFT